MGSSNSTIEEFMGKTFPLNNYEVIEKRHDAVLCGEIHLIQNKQDKNDIKLMKEYQYFDKKSIGNEIADLEKSIKINNSCPYFLKIFGYSHSKDSHLCGNIQKIYLIYENISNTLYSEKISRLKSKKDFEEFEILNFIENVVEAINFLYKNNMGYSCLQTRTIFINENKFKLPNPTLFSLSPNYMKFLKLSQMNDFYLSPETLANVKEKSIFVKSDDPKSDIFVLGCISLELLSKSLKIEDVYQENFSVNTKLIERKLNLINNESYQNVYPILKEMLVEDHKKRIGFEELLIKIKPLIFQNTTSPIKDVKSKIRLTNNKKISHNTSMKELNQYHDELLKKFDESKKTLLSNSKSENSIPLQRNPDYSIPQKNAKNKNLYELVEELFPDGSVYKGEKLNKKRHGKGKFIYSDGGIYEGDWNEGKMHGYGVLYYGDQKIAYEGEWKEDKFEGRGILYNEKNSISYDEKSFDLKNLDNLNNFWVKYEGNFVADQKHGSGILYLPNGDKISGGFLKDKLSDKNCVLYKKNGEVKKGEWLKNKLVKLF